MMILQFKALTNALHNRRVNSWVTNGQEEKGINWDHNFKQEHWNKISNKILILLLIWNSDDKYLEF